MNNLTITVNQTREGTIATWEVFGHYDRNSPRSGKFNLSSTDMHCAQDVLRTNAKDAEKICSLVSWFNKVWDFCISPAIIKFQVYGMNIDEETYRYSQDVIRDVIEYVNMGRLKNWYYCYFREEIPRD